MTPTVPAIVPGIYWLVQQLDFPHWFVGTRMCILLAEELRQCSALCMRASEIMLHRYLVSHSCWLHCRYADLGLPGWRCASVDQVAQQVLLAARASQDLVQMDGGVGDRLNHFGRCHLICLLAACQRASWSRLELAGVVPNEAPILTESYSQCP